MNPLEIKPEMDELKPGVHALDHPDIWARIVSVLEEDWSYGSIADLVQSRQLNRLIGPVLKKIEKRIVLELNDLSRTPESKWGTLSMFIVARPLSALPYEAFWPDKKVNARMETIKSKLKPYTIAYQGHCHPCTVKLWQFFPGARILRIQEDPTTQPLRDIGPLHLKARQDMFPPNHFLGPSSRLRSMSSRVALRTSTLANSRPGQQQLIMYATTTSGLILKRQSLDVFIDEDFQKETLTNLEDSTILPTDAKSKSIAIDYYVQVFNIEAGPLFATGPDDYPSGYKRLSRIVDRIADQHLDKKSPNSRVTFRFFVIRHAEWQPRSEMKPMYQTVVELEAGSHRKRVLNVLERTVHHDFAMRVVNRGRSRCPRR
ncbi:hypothetical protein QFC20_004404 [Naganishia adeliensis]|uniref:Uncharacterized protein n=1 Tax=Naganishia adeliensis TaxID=92952 RepID=A0ACC2W1Z5_9TREE|nr:hypothetical protein QFC20_004404 [Naganishia adeliensis]